jgi:lipopolysaccharide/colanic/teichoic acid biosynthesis glycosyltransferase
MTYQVAKRSLDLVTALIALVLFGPVLVVLSALIRLTMGDPILFRQVRVGFKERRFRIVKFRTMNKQSDASGGRLPDEQRLTAFGRFLRSSSLDELPQLWNVIKSEMSLVGPRPLLQEYLERYNSHQRRRHNIKPGITGWAQVNGRNALTWEEKLDLDIWYVDHRSFWLDIKILWLTLLKVLHRDGISQNGHATMEEFMGSTNTPGKHD